MKYCVGILLILLMGCGTSIKLGDKPSQIPVKDYKVPTPVPTPK
jgi:hypothetical protein